MFKQFVLGRRIHHFCIPLQSLVQKLAIVLDLNFMYVKVSKK